MNSLERIVFDKLAVEIATAKTIFCKLHVNDLREDLPRSIMEALRNASNYIEALDNNDKKLNPD